MTAEFWVGLFFGAGITALFASALIMLLTAMKTEDTIASFIAFRREHMAATQDPNQLPLV